MPRYPKLAIRSKNELAKRISGRDLSPKEALALINDVLANYDQYWRDSKSSQPEKGKFVRNAKGSPLGRLLGLIDKRVLKSHDRLVPDFIFGGVSGKDHIQAAYHLLGKKRQRTLLGLDISTFFERVREDKVFYFFWKRCECTVAAARLLARLCCVPLGPKGSTSNERSIGRGFATSTRLALWCNLDLFLRVSWLAKRHFKGHDPRVAIFVDDIGVTASRVERDAVERFSFKIESMFNAKALPINTAKKKIRSTSQGMQHLGLKLGRNKVSPGSKTESRMAHIRDELKKSFPKTERVKLLQRNGAYYAYKKHIKKLAPVK